MEQGQQLWQLQSLIVKAMFHLIKSRPCFFQICTPQHMLDVHLKSSLKNVMKLPYQCYHLSSFKAYSVEQASNPIQSYGIGLGLEELLHRNLNRIAELTLVIQA